MISNYLLMPRVFKRVLATYGQYRDGVVEIMALRPDLDEETIIELTTKMFNSTTMSMKSILDELIFRAQHKESFPGEENGTWKNG